MIKDDKFDIICVGFGPANLALTTALAENLGPSVTMKALERKPEFAWHPDLQFATADCQVSFMKDLATLRDPRSEFTFLNYLHSQERLLDFIDFGSNVASRDDFSEYFRWAASKVSYAVSYGSQVTDIIPITEAGVVSYFRVVYERLGQIHSSIAKTLSIAVGGRPRLPVEFARAVGSRCFHSDHFLSSFGALGIPRNAAISVAIVGSGQSAVDIATYLLLQYDDIDVTVYCRGYSFRAADDNPFLNKFFTAENAAAIHSMRPAYRAALAAEYYDTGVSVADGRQLRQLYELVYRERSRNKCRFRVRNYRTISSAETTEEKVRLSISNHATSEIEVVDADVVVCATGYERTTNQTFMGKIACLIGNGSEGHPDLDADYSVSSLESHPASIYLQGYAAYTHGVGDEALSLVASRASVIAKSIACDLGR